jgi:hypothetical protein
MKIQAGNERVAFMGPIISAIRKAYPRLGPSIDDVMSEAKHGLVLTLEPLEFEQTGSQRGYYHMWKRRFADWCGATPDEMHEYLLCETYGSEHVETMIGLQLRPLQRSSKANRVEYSKLIDTLIRVAAEMGFHVPPPA